MSIKSLPALETALAHRSIRKFSDKPVPPEILAALIDAGRMASTSNHLQCVSVIRITDAAIRAGIRRAASDMAYVTECPEFLLFCADFHKHHLLLPEAQTDWAEALLIGAVDTGIMAQNVLLVANRSASAASILVRCVTILRRWRNWSGCPRTACRWSAFASAIRRRTHPSSRVYRRKWCCMRTATVTPTRRRLPLTMKNCARITRRGRARRGIGWMRCKTR